MIVDETKVKLLREAWFARNTGKVGAGIPTSDELKIMSQAFYEEIKYLPDDERADVLHRILHTVPEDEYEGAVAYLKRTVDPENMREILDLMERDRKAGVKTKLSFTAKMDIRSMLRQGGFTWNSIYLDDNCQQILLDAAKRFASEHPELEFDF